MDQFLRRADPSNEVEFRFKGASALSMKDIASYYEDQKFRKTKENSVSVIGRIKFDADMPSDLRMISVQGKPDTFMTKNQIGRPLFTDHFKLVESKETIIPGISKGVFERLYNTVVTRKRERVSYTNGDFKVDLTVIDGETHEVELECLTRKALNNPYAHVNAIVAMIEKHHPNAVKHEYKRLLNMQAYRFAGSLPYTITMEIFNTGKLNCGYTVTDKADGLRYHLMVTSSGHGYFMGRGHNDIRYMGHFPGLENTVIDGEYVKNVFYTFDALVVMGKDVRQVNLIQRLLSLKMVFDVVKQRKYVMIKSKTFYGMETKGIYRIESGRVIHTRGDTKKMMFGQACVMIWRNRAKFPYTLDGLVFTPILPGYNNTEIFKWKPYDTIDFFVRKNSTRQWTLHIAGNNNGRYMHLPFAGASGNGTFHVKPRDAGYANKIFADTSIPDSVRRGVIQVSPGNANKYADNSVVEFKYENSTFVPIGSRPDKAYANNILSVNDAWESISQPITEAILRAGVYKSCIRVYHNAIKNDLIETFMTNKTVLDIGFGAGGDIKKYETHRVKVIGVDIVEPKYKLGRDVRFIKVTGDMYNITDVLKNSSTKTFDVVNCQFAMHYFFRNEATLQRFIQNVSKALKPGGRLVATVLDGERVKKAMNGLVKHGYCGKRRIFTLKRDTEGHRLSVDLAGTAYFENTTSEEYLVNINRFTKAMKKAGFKLEMAKKFSSFQKKFKTQCDLLCPDEKVYSFLNTVLVLQKIA